MERIIQQIIGNQAPPQCIRCLQLLFQPICFDLNSTLDTHTHTRNGALSKPIGQFLMDTNLEYVFHVDENDEQHTFP